MLCDEIKDWWETAGFSCTYQYVIYAVLKLNEIQINIVKNKHSSKNMQEKNNRKNVTISHVYMSENVI